MLELLRTVELELRLLVLELRTERLLLPLEFPDVRTVLLRVRPVVLLLTLDELLFVDRLRFVTPLFCVLLPVVVRPTFCVRVRPVLTEEFEPFERLVPTFVPRVVVVLVLPVYRLRLVSVVLVLPVVTFPEFVLPVFFETIVLPDDVLDLVPVVFLFPFPRLTKPELRGPLIFLPLLEPFKF